MDYRRIISDAAVSGVRIAVYLLQGIITIPLFTKLLGSSAFGVWTTLLGIIQIFSVFGRLHLSGGLVRYIKEDTAFIDMLTLLLLSTSSVTLLFWIGTSLAATHFTIPIPQELFIPAGALIGVRILLHFFMNYPRAKRQVKYHEGIFMLQLLTETILLALVLFTVRRLSTAIWGLVGVDLLFLLILAAKFLPGELKRPTPRKFRKYLVFSLPMVPKELSERLLSHGDKILVITLMGPSAAGVYAAAYGVTSLLSEGGQLFDATLYPNVTDAWDKGNYGEIASLYNYFLRGYIILIIPAIVGFSLVGRALLTLISTPAIVEQGVLLIPILVLGFAFQGMQKALSFPIAAAEQTTVLSIITVIIVGLNLALNIILIPFFGLLGAAVATTISFTGRSLALFYLVNTHLDVHFPYHETGVAGAGAALMAIGLTILPTVSAVGMLVLYPVVGVGIYGVALILLGGVSYEEWTQLRQFLTE
jgi:O-antigen/teichoic acid export membrane protein